MNETTNTKLCKFAIMSLVAGILGFVIMAPVMGIIAFVFGFIALNKIKGSNNLLKGKGLAIAGIVLGTVIWVLIICSILFAFSFRTHYQPFRVPATSMEPTIKKGEKVMVDRKAYANLLPQRGDIVVCETEVKGEKRLLLKRIVGLPNEELEIKDGNIYIDGKLTKIPELPKEVYYYYMGDFGKQGQIIKIPNDCYYMLGDNSMNSMDSRFTGFVNKKDIYGKVISVYAGKYPPKLAELLRSFLQK